MSTAIDFILKNVTLSEIKAINSPWVLSSNVVSTLDENPSPEKVVSLELAKQLHQSLFNYIPLSAIAQDYNTDDGLKVISQKVAYTLVHELSNSYILQSDIIGSLEAAENWDSSEER